MSSRACAVRRYPSLSRHFTRFMNYVEKTLASRPAEANLGGVPSVQNKIRAFLNVKYQKGGQWSNPSLEVSEIAVRDSIHSDAVCAADCQQYADVGQNLLSSARGTLK